MPTKIAQGTTKGRAGRTEAGYTYKLPTEDPTPAPPVETSDDYRWYVLVGSIFAGVISTVCPIFLSIVAILSSIILGVIFTYLTFKPYF